MKKNLVILMAVIMILGLTSCGENETKVNDVQETKEVSNEVNSVEEVSKVGNDELLKKLMSKADEVEVTEDSVIFQDDSGREKIEIKKNPQKVAIMYGSYASLWMENGGKVSLGIGGKSAIEMYKDQLGRDITEDSDMTVVAETPLAKNWDIEKILAEKPDLIIASNAMNGYSIIQGPAESANIPVIALDYKGVDDYIKWSKVFANINDKPELFEENAQKTIKDVAETISKVPENDNPNVLILFPQEKVIKANLKGTDIGVIVDDLRANNLADKISGDVKAKRLDINIEDIYAAKPDIILVQCLGSEEFAREKIDDAFGENPIWQELDAVKNDKVYYLPRLLFHYRPNKGYNEAYRMMAEILYPNIDFSN